MKRIVFTVLLGVTGYFCQRAWMPSADALAARSPLKINRDQAIEIARKVASSQGIETQGWRFGVAVDAHERTAAALQAGPSRLLSSYPLAEIQVGGYDSARQASLRVSLSPEGRVLSWTLHDGKLRQSRDDQDRPEAAEAQFRATVGEEAGRFEKVIAGARSQDGFRTVWEAPDPERPSVLMRYTAMVRGGRLATSELGLEIGDPALSDYQRESQAKLMGILPYVTAYYWIVIALTLWMFFSAFLRRQDQLRMGIAACFLGLPWLVASLLLSGGVDEVALAISDAPSSAGTARLLLILSEFVPVALTAILLCAGYAVLPHTERRAWVGLKLLSERRLLARPIGSEVAAGLMFGAAMCALLLLPARLGLTPPSTPPSVPLLLMQKYPLLQSLNPAASWSTIVPLVILIPFCRSLRPSLRWLLIPALALGVAAYLNFGSVARFDWKSSAALGVALYVLSLVAYRMWGVLTAMVAPASAITLYLSSALLSMPAERLQSAGWVTLLVWTAGLGLATVVGWRGEEVAGSDVMERMDPPSSQVNRSERKRLQADFDVARRAQQDMLPERPPEIPGYTFAASCRPAYEVGGDLFDFLRFPSGELGLCVADVSGKGVSASLYMTMTKGMLTAALEEPADLTSILSRLNRHLKDWGRKRTFVTMSLALLETESGRLRHARAGHNPPVLLREGRASLLQPAGLGLGMVGPASFDRALKVEEIQLQPGDCFVLYSDGLTECMNRDLEQFGEERLLSIVEASAGLPAAEVEDAVLRAVTDFQGDAEAHDDLTILVVRREHVAEPAIA